MVGPSHWLAGSVRSSHLTLGAVLEPYRSAVPAGDPLVARHTAALLAAVDGIGPLRFAVAGLTLPPRSVMACAVPADTAPIELARAFTAALSAEGCSQAGREPDIWYSNLVYYTGSGSRRARPGRLGDRAAGGQGGGCRGHGHTARPAAAHQHMHDPCRARFSSAAVGQPSRSKGRRTWNGSRIIRSRYASRNVRESHTRERCGRGR